MADGLAFARLETGVDGHHLDVTEVVHDGGAAYAVRFEVRLEPSWVTSGAKVWVSTSDGVRSLDLRSADGRWSRDGVDQPELTGCVDVDVAAAPATNTLPIRRMDLAVGETREFPVAWVDVPSLRMRRSSQRYTRLPGDGEVDRYEYRDDLYGPFELTVDAAGMVVDYEDLARRLR